jgi:hypothetical protein
MGRTAGSRRVSDTGSTTGVAVTILALISAGTVASITLVGVHQLAPAVSRLGSDHEQSSVRAPRGVVVTPRPAASPSSVGGSDGQSKPRAGSPPNATVVQVAAPTARRSVTHVITAVGRIPLRAVKPTSVGPTSPALAMPTLNASAGPSLRVLTVQAHPSRAPLSRLGHGRPTDHPAPPDPNAKSHRGDSGCGQHGSGAHHGRCGDHRGHRSQGHGGNGGSLPDRYSH